MVPLHERLSEFSYGYGITREAETLLARIGLASCPFLPSLLHEAELGFDVAFANPGAVLMLQFKLGEELRRFRRAEREQAIPMLSRPFWRFGVDLSEHQFCRLYEAELSGAEVYYVSPRFSTWEAYERAFHDETVLDRSLLIAPTGILNCAGAHNGKHRVVYDRWRCYLCSDPIIVEETTPDQVGENLVHRLRTDEPPLAEAVKRLATLEDVPRQTARLSPRQRVAIQSRARTTVEADAAIVGLEAWLQGAQVIFVTTNSE